MKTFNRRKFIKLCGSGLAAAIVSAMPKMATQETEQKFSFSREGVHIYGTHVWNCALTDTEVMLIASGIDPSLIRPDNIVIPKPPVTTKKSFTMASWIQKNGNMHIEITQ